MGLLQICQTIEGVKDYSDDPWGWVDHGYIEDGALMCFDWCHIFKATKEQRSTWKQRRRRKTNHRLSQMWQVIKRKLVYSQNYVGQLQQHSCKWGIWWPVTSIFVSKPQKICLFQKLRLPAEFWKYIVPVVQKWLALCENENLWVFLIIIFTPQIVTIIWLCGYKFKMAGGQPYSPWAFRLSFRLPTHIDAYLLIYRNLEPALNFPPVPSNHLANVPTLKSSKFWVIYKDDLKNINNIITTSITVRVAPRACKSAGPKISRKKAIILDFWPNTFLLFRTSLMAPKSSDFFGKTICSFCGPSPSPVSHGVAIAWRSLDSALVRFPL